MIVFQCRGTSSGHLRTCGVSTWFPANGPKFPGTNGHESNRSFLNLQHNRNRVGQETCKLTGAMYNSPCARKRKTFFQNRNPTIPASVPETRLLPLTSVWMDVRKDEGALGHNMPIVGEANSTT